MGPQSKSFFKIQIEKMKLSSLIVLASGALGAPAPAVQNKAPVVIQGQTSFRPPPAMLINAVHKEKYDEVDELLLGKVGFSPVDINSQNYMGKSVIAVAVEDLNIEMVKHLIEISKEAKLELDFNSKDYWGNTPLHLVATAPSKPLEYGQKATDWTLKRRFEHAHTIMKLLLVNGADPNAKNDYNVTPLVTAAAIGFRAGCEELVDHGADMNYIVEPAPERINRYGEYTALDVAFQQKNYLTSIERGTFYYDDTIGYFCKNQAKQNKLENACASL